MPEKRRKYDYTIGNTRYETLSGGGRPDDTLLSPVRPNAPRAPLVQRPDVPVAAPKAIPEPTLLTKENSTMGWQARIAANRELMDNYRTQLQTTAQAGITEGADRSALERTRATNASAERIATRGNTAAAARQAAGATSEAALLGTQIAAEERVKGADRDFAEKQTGRREVFDENMAKRNQQSLLDMQREATGAELFTRGAFESPGALQNYTRFGPSSVGGMKVPTQQQELKYYAPVFDTNVSANGAPRVLVPPMVFNPITGETTYDLEDVPEEDAIAIAQKRLDQLKKRRNREE